MRATRLSGALAALVLVTGCASGADEAPDPGVTGVTGVTGESSGTPTAAPDVPDFPAGTGRQEGDGPARSMMVLRDVRVAEHPGFDRVVLDLRGRGAPGWVVEYVDEAVVEGSGDVVDLAEGAVLQVVASGTTAPAPGYYEGPQRLGAVGAQVAEVYVVGTFEGYTQVFVGLDGAEAPFRTFRLADPARLVVDVRDADAG